MAERSASLCKSGGGKLVHKTVNIGTNTSYNITSLCPNYKDLTTANFAVSTNGYGSTTTGYKSFSNWYQTLTLAATAWHTAPGISSYNASTGVVYINQGKSGASCGIQSNSVSGELTLSLTLHLVYIE